MSTQSMDKNRLSLLIGGIIVIVMLSDGDLIKKHALIARAFKQKRRN